MLERGWGNKMQMEGTGKNTYHISFVYMFIKIAEFFKKKIK